MGDPKQGASPPTWKLMIAKYCGLLPALLVVAYAIEWLPVDPVLWLKLILETLIVVPLMHYVITPAVDSLFHGWLYDGVEEENGGGRADRSGRSVAKA